MYCRWNCLLMDRGRDVLFEINFERNFWESSYCKNYSMNILLYLKINCHFYRFIIILFRKEVERKCNKELLYIYRFQRIYNNALTIHYSCIVYQSKLMWWISIVLIQYNTLKVKVNQKISSLFPVTEKCK